MTADCRVTENGAFIVSIDLELFWGVHDVARLEDHRSSLLRVRKLVPRLLELFEHYQVHATWATVGFLFFRTREALKRALPRCLPAYSDSGLSPYARIADIGRDETEDPFHLAPTLLEAIKAAPHQEIGSHTFSHYYCLEDAQTAEAFRDDLVGAIRAARELGVTLRSLVFPRNQVNPEYLRICDELSITTYRGTESSWLYRPRPYSRESWVRRLARLADSYCNLTGHHTYPLDGSLGDSIVNIPSSRLLPRHLPLLGWLDPLRVRRICTGLTAAARRGHAFHLWMHPEELAEAPEESLRMLESVLRHYRVLHRDYGMESLNMGEAAARIRELGTVEPAVVLCEGLAGRKP